MKTVTILVTDATAKKLVTLAKTGRLSVGTRQERIGDGYRAYRLLTEHARPTWRDGATEIVVDGVTYIVPSTLSIRSL